MTTPRLIVGAALMLLTVLLLFGLPAHVGSAPWARTLLICAAGGIGTQVLLGKRIPGFRWRTRHRTI